MSRRQSSRKRSCARRVLGLLLRDTRAATAVEYGLILAVIVLAMIASFIGVADATTDLWNNISAKVSRAR